jgi:hypothetical protein
MYPVYLLQVHQQWWKKTILFVDLERQKRFEIIAFVNLKIFYFLYNLFVKKHIKIYQRLSKSSFDAQNPQNLLL